VQGDCVPLPEREVSSLASLSPRLPPQAAQARYLHSYKKTMITQIEIDGFKPFKDFKVEL